MKTLVLGQCSSLFYNIYVAEAVTRQGRSYISCSIMLFEAFLGGNTKFNSLNEVITFIHNVVNEKNERKLLDSYILDRNISVSQCRKQNFSKNIAGKNYKVYPVYYPIGNGMMNIDKAIEDLDYIIRTNLKSQKDMDDFER